MIHKKREIVVFLSILILFIGLHIAGLDISYQQDEMKWTYYANQELNPPGTIPHPPLTELVYINLGPIVGDDNYRLIPFAFGLINLFLIFYLAKIIFGTRTAFWTAFLFTISYFSLLASLMVDVEGEVMPMFFLIMAIGYFKLRDLSFELKGKNLMWLGLAVVGAIGSFLVKASGFLPILALALDFAIIKGAFADKKRFFKFIGLGALLAIVLVAVMALAKLVFPFFPVEKSLKYWQHFANSSSFINRGWLQTFIQFAKAIMYSSPLLILPILFIDREIFKKTRPFFLFIFVGLIFYLLAFDFSLGALDRYFQFLIIPLCIISAAVFVKIINYESRIMNYTLPILISIVIFSLQFLPHFVPPLYPKTLWLSRVLSLKWNFLFPFTGGSGPLPFYVSFLFIAITWLVCLLFFIVYLKKPHLKKFVLSSILILGLSYNLVFIEEYLFGRINGNTQTLLNNAVAHIKSNKDIKEVMVYNDNGGFEIRQSGKFKIRIYAAPMFEDGYKLEFAKYNGHILFIDVPKLSENSLYKKYFNSCKVIYAESNKQISSKIYDCSR